MLDLDKYLDVHRAEGVSCSEGSFSLSAQKALDKFSNYQFETPGLWLVKLVQCAVALEASQITISLERQVLRVTIPVDIGLTAEELWDALVGTSSKGRGLDHLLSGIRALYGQHEDLAWVCRTEGGTTALSLHEGALERRESGDKGASFELCVERSKSGGGLSRWLGLSISELDAVRRLCWLAPISVHLDGWPLKCGSNPSSSTAAKWEVRRDALALRVFRSATGRSWITEGDSTFSFDPTPGSGNPYFQKWCSREPGFAEAQVLLTLEKGEGLDSRIRYVYDGAIIEGPSFPVGLFSGYALRAYIPAKNLKVDLSQFRSARPISSGLKRLVCNEGVKLCKCFLAELESVGKKPKNDGETTAVGVGALTAGTFLKTKALFLALGLPAGLLVGGGVATALKMRGHYIRMERMDLRNACLAGIRQLGRVIH